MFLHRYSRPNVSTEWHLYNNELPGSWTANLFSKLHWQITWTLYWDLGPESYLCDYRCSLLAHAVGVRAKLWWPTINACEVRKLFLATVPTWTQEDSTLAMRMWRAGGQVLCFLHSMAGWLYANAECVPKEGLPGPRSSARDWQPTRYLLPVKTRSRQNQLHIWERVHDFI
jgi:hypothetical protein